MLTHKTIFKTWWPLAISWLLMAVEFPFMSAIIARLPNAEINLAAYGGIIFPITWLLQAPVEMLLAASTALNKDWASYIKVRRFMMALGLTLTLLHFLTAFTPLYYLISQKIIGVPAEIVAPARLGLMIMTPFTWAVAFRRFQNGTMIRFGHSRAVAVGTFIRIGVNIGILLLGYRLGAGISPIALTAAAQVCGVVIEALYSALRVRPVVKSQVRTAPLVETLTTTALLKFYTPLALTTFILFSFEFIGSMAVSRMPQALESLAVWPVLSGLIFILQSSGIAYNEVVVALMDKPGAAARLRTFTGLLSIIVAIGTLIFAATPLAPFWFEKVSSLSAVLSTLAQRSFWLALPAPALAVILSWYQGAVLNARQTRGISEACAAALVGLLVVLWAGVVWGQAAGIYIGTGAFMFSTLVQTAWLWFRSREVLQPAGYHAPNEG
jgi:hypothetical protein